MSSTSEINARVEQFLTDLDKAHLIVHGGVGVSVATDGGLVRSFASVINQLDADVEAAADSVIAQVYTARDQAVSAGTNAAASATTATNAATAAQGYRDQAQSYSTSASTSAGTATTQAGLASGYATTANTKAGEASASATSAAQSASVSVNAPGTSATSTTSLTVGTGSKSLTLGQTGKAFLVGQWVYIADSSSPATRWMHGTLTAFNTGTGAMTINVVRSYGTGTVASWLVMPATPNYDTISADGAGNVTFTGGVSLGSSVGQISSTGGGAAAAKTKVPAANPSTDGAFMYFERAGIFGAYFGLDTDNKWKVGGASMGGVAYELLHTGNFNPANYAALAGAAFTGGVSFGGGYVQITQAAGAQRLLLGNQDSLGVNKPSLIVAANGQTIIGYGSTWTGNGGSLTSMAVFDPSYARFALPVQLTDANTSLSQGASYAARVTTPSGYLEFGALNSSYAHFFTDRPSFYMNKALNVDGALYQQGSQVWHAGNINPFRYETFTADANTLPGNRSAFTYAVNAPYTGPIVHFDASNYGMQINAAYSGGGLGLAFRSRYGDGNTWNAWRTIWHDGNFNPANYAALSGASFTGAIGGTRLNAGYDSGIDGSVNAAQWFRSAGNTGWYSADYNGGIYMVDSTWIRTYGNKGVLIQSGISSYGMLNLLGNTAGQEVSINYRDTGQSQDDGWTVGKYGTTAFFWYTGGQQIMQLMRSSGDLYIRGTLRVGAAGGVPMSGGNAVWHAGNFNPASYAALAGAAFTGAVSATRFAAGYDAAQAGAMSASNWFRSSGSTGWYNDTYGGGIYMADGSYLRVSGTKGLSVPMGGGDDPFGAVGVTRSADSNTYAYFGMTRSGNVAWATGINSSNSMAFGTGTTGLNGVISSVAATLTSGGNFTANNVSQTSDERLKSAWEDLPEDYVERLAGLKIGTYLHSGMTGRHAGASAQSMRGVLPEVVLTHGDDEDAMLTISYGPAALVSAGMLARRLLAAERRIAILEDRA